MNVLLVSLALIMICLVDMPAMIKGKRWKHLTIYSVLLALVFTLGFLLALNVPVPSPIIAIQTLYQRLGISFKPGP